jgi:uncharacterized RDD family membrane protein YckC
MMTVDPGFAVTQQGHYAGPVTRVAAFAIDQAVVGGVFAGGTAVLLWLWNLVTAETPDPTAVPVLTLLVFAGWWFLYFAYPWATSGKTPGMAILGIRVVRRDGAPARLREAVLRPPALALSMLTLGLGFVGILVGREHRGLHDVIAGTVVVYGWDARGARLRFLARTNPDEPGRTPRVGGASAQQARRGSTANP